MEKCIYFTLLTDAGKYSDLGLSDDEQSDEEDSSEDEGLCFSRKLLE